MSQGRVVLTLNCETCENHQEVQENVFGYMATERVVMAYMQAHSTGKHDVTIRFVTIGP